MGGRLRGWFWSGFYMGLPGLAQTTELQLLVILNRSFGSCPDLRGSLGCGSQLREELELTREVERGDLPQLRFRE